MKKVIILILFLPFLVFSCHSIKLYDAKISPTDITGTRSFGPKNELVVSELMKDPVTRPISDDNALFDMLGRFVITDTRSPEPLLDMTASRKLNVILDEINFDYYEDWAIPQILNKDLTISKDPKYVEFKKRLNTLGTIAEKKELLCDEQFAEVKEKLEKSRFYFDEKNFYQDQKVVRKITTKINANVTAALKKNNVELTNETKQELNKYINNNIIITGNYIEAYFKDKYLDYVVPKFRKHFNKDLEYDDYFTPQLVSFFNKDDNAIISGVASIKVKIDYTSEGSLKSFISNLLKGQLDSGDPRLPKVTADIFASFDVDRKSNATTSSNHYYILRYSYNTRLRVKNLKA